MHTRRPQAAAYLRRRWSRETLNVNSLLTQAFVFYGLIILCKAGLIRFMCARQGSFITKLKTIAIWCIALCACVLPALCCAAIGAIFIPFALVQATSPPTGHLDSAIAGTLLIMPLYWDWHIDIWITIVCWSFYKGMVCSKPILWAPLTYAVIVIFEYCASFFAYMHLCPNISQ